jgi:hypothetical protein
LRVVVEEVDMQVGVMELGVMVVVVMEEVQWLRPRQERLIRVAVVVVAMQLIAEWVEVAFA